MFVARRTLQEPVNTGLCACGCGTPTPIGTDNRPDRGYQKGQPVRYISGHQVKKGNGNHKWKGGRFTHKSGYVYRYAPDHPNARDGYVFEHRLVMEEKLGRILDPKERVHHLNHNPGDNRPENLTIYGSQREHMLAEHPDHYGSSLGAWRAGDPVRAFAYHREAGLKGAATRWAGHVKVGRKRRPRKRKQFTLNWSVSSRFV